MNVLSFNTTGLGSEFCLQKDGKKFFLETEFSKHSETFFPLLDDFLKKNNTSLSEIDFFGVCNGPGSFTGIRIGLSVAKMFAFALNKPCVVVNALKVLAYNNFDKTKNQKICSVINAGAENLFYELFEIKDQKVLELTLPKVCTFSQFRKIKEQLTDFKFLFYDDKKQSSTFFELLDFDTKFTAKALGDCVENEVKNKKFLGVNEIVPLYLRSSQAEKTFFNEFEIVVAGKNDLDDLLELEKTADDGLPWSKTALEQSFDNQSFCCVMLKNKESVLGYLSFFKLVDEFEILRVVVLPNARGQGVAKTLLKFLFDQAKQEETESIVLEVNQFNFSGRLLYEQLGFDVVGTRKDYYAKGQDALIMRKFIQME